VSQVPGRHGVEGHAIRIGVGKASKLGVGERLSRSGSKKPFVKETGVLLRAPGIVAYHAPRENDRNLIGT
jgi:hypothetical protein